MNFHKKDITEGHDIGHQKITNWSDYKLSTKEGNVLSLLLEIKCDLVPLLCVYLWCSNTYLTFKQKYFAARSVPYINTSKQSRLCLRFRKEVRKFRQMVNIKTTWWVFFATKICIKILICTTWKTMRVFNFNFLSVFETVLISTHLLLYEK